MKRTFLAIEIDLNDKLLETYNCFLSGLKNEKIKWVNPYHFHITLFFLGETREEQIPAIINEVEQSVIGFQFFELSLRGCGVFPSPSQPSVLWFGIEPNIQLEKLKFEIDKTLDQIGFPAEKRIFKPHLTIARIKEIKNISRLAELLKYYKNEFLAQVTIEKLVYFESLLTPAGPVYSKLREFHFSDH